MDHENLHSDALVNNRDFEVDLIMNQIPENYQYVWCGAGNSSCACRGCVQVFNKKVIVEMIEKKQWTGDPEYISEQNLMKSVKEYTKGKVTKQEWLAWRERHPVASTQKLFDVVSIEQPSGRVESPEKELYRYSLEDPIEYIVS